MFKFVLNQLLKCMKKLDNLFLVLCLMSGLLLVGCGGSGEESGGSNEAEEAQAMEKKEEERASPLKTAEGTIGDKKVFIQYGAPHVKGRKIWGDLEAYGEVWRTGANEATYLDLSEDMTVEGKTLPAGKYSLFTIPKKDENWTVIFNSDWDLEHGHYQYKEENDVLRVEVKPEWVDDVQEEMEITIEDPGVVIRWEKLRLPIQVN